MYTWIWLGKNKKNILYDATDRWLYVLYKVIKLNFIIEIEQINSYHWSTNIILWKYIHKTNWMNLLKIVLFFIVHFMCCGAVWFLNVGSNKYSIDYCCYIKTWTMKKI